MFKRSQHEVSESSRHWYQDKYQHVLTQRNVLALISIIALVAAAVAVFAVMRLAPLKSVEPYLVQIDEKTGFTQRIIPSTRAEYAAKPSVDRYFTSLYVTSREGYNPTTLRYSQNVVRVMSTSGTYFGYRRQTAATNEDSAAAKLGEKGQREVTIKSLAYIQNPVQRGAKSTSDQQKIMQVRITTYDSMAAQSMGSQDWVVTLAFEYTNLKLNTEEQLLNPLGFTVTSYQIQREIN